MTVESDILKANLKVESAKEDLIKAVANARVKGYSWQDIANILGCSRQNARMRFSKYFEESTIITFKGLR